LLVTGGHFAVPVGVIRRKPDGLGELVVRKNQELRRFWVLLAGLVLAGHGLAQTPGDINAAARQSETIQRQQQERLREDLDKARQAVPAVDGTDLRNLRPQVAVPELGVACRQIGEIRVAGADHLAPELVASKTRPFVGQCLGVGEIEAILSELTRAYIERGLITARAYLPAQDLRSGVLQIQVIEGAIEGYRIEGEGSRIFAPGVFPAAPGELLNLRDLEQGIDQINRLASNNAQLDIQPGSKPGSSIVVVRNTPTFPLHLLLSYDNQGTRSTGNHGAAASLSFDNPLGLNERFLYSHRKTWSEAEAGHNSQNDAFEFWLPFGYWSLTLSTSRSDYLNALTVPSGAVLRSEGNTETSSIGLDRVLYRDQSMRSSFSMKLTTQEAKNYLERQLLTVSSRKLTFLDFGLRSSSTLFGGMASGQLGYAQGLKNLGALADAADIDRDTPHAQFRKTTLDLSFLRNFSLFGQDLSWSSQFSGQYALTSLYGSQQMLIGGHGSVRGFVNSSLSGDHGYFWRNELGVPCRLPLFGASIPGRAFVAYDFGSVSSIAAGSTQGSLSGAALGVSLQWKDLSLEVSASRPLSMPAGVTREAAHAWLRLSYSL